MSGRRQGRWGRGRLRGGHGVVLALLACLITARPVRGQLPFEGEPINYLTAPVNDPVARLQKLL